MAAIVTLLGSATFTTTSGTKTVTATPAVGELIVIVTAHTGNTSTAAPTDNNSGGGGTYTLINTAVKATSADTMKMWVRDALITSATSTVFTHAPGTSTGGGLAVLDISGMDKAGATAVVRSAIQSNQAAAGTPAPVLGAVPSVTNPIITAVFNATNPANVTARTGYTRIVNAGYNTPASGLAVAKDDSGETSATITWGSTSGTAFGSIAVELDARVTHAATGDLVGDIGSVSGSADRQAAAVTHAATGALTGDLGAVVGSAARTRAHASTGTLTGDIGSVSGAADRQAGFVTHDASGALTGPGSAVAGSAARTRAHASTGALSGPGTTLAGSAARTRVHASSGVLAGAGAVIAGSAARNSTHASTGALQGPGATLAGSAARVGAPPNHVATGALVGPGATLAGAASRSGSAVTHDASGALVGPGAVVTGEARGPSQAAGGYDDDEPKKRKPKKRFFVERDGKLLVFGSAQAATSALDAATPAVPEQAEPPPEQPVEIEIKLPEVQAYAEVVGRIEDYQAAFNSRHYEALLALFEQMREDEDIEMLLLSC